MRPLLAALACSLAFAAGASGHTNGSHTGFVSTVSGIQPQLPGLLVQVIGGHERLSVRNWTQKTVIVFGADGRAVATLAPGESRVWADTRIGASGPPPKREELVRRWRIPGEADGEPFEIGGFLGYRPPAGASSSGNAALPVWAVALASAGGALVLAAALALPLLRRKGEGEAGASDS
jgi:hypothetical protein